jgi:hypothetical protein
MNDESLKAMIESLASGIDDYIELIAVKKDLMTQKTYSTKRDQHISLMGDNLALIVETRLKSKCAQITPDELNSLPAEERELTRHLVDFIDLRIKLRAGKS